MGFLGGNKPNIKLNIIFPFQFFFYLTMVRPFSNFHSSSLLPRSIVLSKDVSSSPLPYMNSYNTIRNENLWSTPAHTVTWVLLWKFITAPWNSLEIFFLSFPLVYLPFLSLSHPQNDTFRVALDYCETLSIKLQDIN